MDVFPFGGSAANRNDYQMPTPSDYQAISADNAEEWETDYPGYNDYMVTWWHLNINTPVEDIDTIRFRWNGNTDGGTTNHILWVLRNASRDDWEQNSAWDQLNSVDITADADSDLIGWINSSIGDYVDSRYGNITFLVENANRSSEEMRTNYVELWVNGSQVCLDPFVQCCLDIWAYPGYTDLLQPSCGSYEHCYLCYDCGTRVPIEAGDAMWGQFCEWTGDVETVDDVFDRSTDVTMNDTYTIYAEFT